MKTSISILAGLLLAGSVHAAEPVCRVAVSHDPLVMRMSKDEFRIAFGLSGERCEQGCSGVVRYQASWRTEDGAETTEPKLVGYTIPSGSNHTIAVDRSYFDLGEAKHTTDVVRIDVADVSCAPARLTAER